MLAIKILIKGVVQGVGFRPTVYRIADTLGLQGWVKNSSNGVEVVINTSSSKQFLSALTQSLPSLAKIDSIQEEIIDVEDAPNDFTILTNSRDHVFNNTPIPIDSCICDNCISDIFNSKSKYHLYPFTNCCDCGPRYTVISDLPYRRLDTTLACFPLCESCNDEFINPRSRRYHAEASSCQNCGPKMDLGLDVVANYILNGNIVALKTTGGYVLIADSANSATISSLRIRKRRKAKPFALMALNTQSIKDYYCKVNLYEQQLLKSKQSPIVILERNADCFNNAQEIAPNLNTLGFMLPNTPMYYLLFYYLLGSPRDLKWQEESYSITLIVTSANLTGDSIIHEDDEARKSLKQIADVIVGYNREIIIPCDDSVVLPLKQQDIIIRRSRGYAPELYHFNYKLPQVLGLGAHQKNTICFTRDYQVYLSQYLGDMSSHAVIKNFNKTLQHYKHIFGFKPQLVVSDLHPDFHTTLVASRYELPHLQLQHHYAHLAATMASCQSIGQKLQQKVIGCILDGYGYGVDANSWGGELIKFDMRDLSFTRLSHIPFLTILGGADNIERKPWILAFAWCQEHNLPIPWHIANLSDIKLVNDLNRNKFSTRTTSMGRLFSLVSALLGICCESSYEAEAVLRLESMVTKTKLESKYAKLTVDGKPDISSLIETVYHIAFKKGSITEAVNTFYSNLGDILAQWVIYHALNQGVYQVAIGGGCWQSRYLLPLVKAKLHLKGFDLLIPQGLPLNDEGISFGQAWYGAQHLLLGKI